MSARRVAARTAILPCLVAVLLWGGTVRAVASPTHGSLTVAQIVEKNVAARGGLDAWRHIQTMVWVGHMESIGAAEPRLGFTLEQKRPNKTLFEISTLSQKTQRIFDGTQGWKVRPERDGTLDAQPYSQPEIKFAKEAQGIDGPLIDYQTKGNLIELKGIEQLEGRKTYRLSVRLPAGERHDVWIDAQTFLDLRYDRTSYSPTGVPGTVSVYYRNYQSIEGVRMPLLVEIGVGSSLKAVPDKMIIEKVVLNAPLDDDVFAKPGTHSHRMAASTHRRAPGTAVSPAAPAPDEASAAQPASAEPRSPAPP